jgi:hypothetical protein
MSRPFRIRYPRGGISCHLPGQRTTGIVRDDPDRWAFLEILVESQAIYNVKLYPAVRFRIVNQAIMSPPQSIERKSRQGTIRISSWTRCLRSLQTR